MTKKDRAYWQKVLNSIRDLLSKDEEAKWVEDNRWKVGTYWKYENSYGSGGKWFLYARVLAIAEGGRAFETRNFETDCYGQIRITPKDHNYLSGFVRINGREYDQAYADLRVTL